MRIIVKGGRMRVSFRKKGLATVEGQKLLKRAINEAYDCEYLGVCMDFGNVTGDFLIIHRLAPYDVVNMHWCHRGSNHGRVRNVFSDKESLCSHVYQTIMHYA